MTDTTNLTTIRAIGKGVRLTEQAVPQILATAPEGFDPNVRGAVRDLVHTWAGFPNKADRPAVTTGSKGNQTPTDYGTGVDTLAKAVKRAMSEKSTPATPDYLALAVQAATTARTKGVDGSTILAAIERAMVDASNAGA